MRMILVHNYARVQTEDSDYMYTHSNSGFHTGFLGWKKFVGHCHSVMHEFAITCEQTLYMYNFSSFLGGGGGGGVGGLRLTIPGPPLSV